MLTQYLLKYKHLDMMYCCHFAKGRISANFSRESTWIPLRLRGIDFKRIWVIRQIQIGKGYRDCNRMNRKSSKQLTEGNGSLRQKQLHSLTLISLQLFSR